MSNLNYINDLFKSLDFLIIYLIILFLSLMRTLILALDMVLISMVTILNLLDLDLFLKIISSVLIAALSNIMNLKVYVRFPCLILPMVIKDSLLRLNTEDISVIHVILILRMISLLNLKYQNDFFCCSCLPDSIQREYGHGRYFSYDGCF